ncbi:MAG: hypothetical protein AAGF45_01155 [Pseudomonadota bacterium]
MTRAITLAEGLDGLEQALNGRPTTYEGVLAALRDLPRVHGTEPEAVVTRAFHAAYRILGIEAGGAPMRLSKNRAYQLQHLYACAVDIIEKALVDDDVALGRRFGDRPGRAVTPMKMDEAAVRMLLAPYLERYAERMGHHPAEALAFGYNSLLAGRPPADRVVEEWLRGCDARGVGLAGTADAIVDAIIILDDGLYHLPETWKPRGPEMMRTACDSHPLRAAAAGRWLGAFYREPARADVPPFEDMLRFLAQVRPHSRTVAGAFINGLDDCCMGFAALTQHFELPRAFDVKGWCLNVLEGAPEDYNPAAQAFWFYLHEYFDFDAAFVAELYRAGHSFEALMCATEHRGRVDGMAAVLKRIARDPDPEIAQHALTHLKEFYAA